MAKFFKCRDCGRYSLVERVGSGSLFVRLANATGANSQQSCNLPPAIPCITVFTNYFRINTSRFRMNRVPIAGMGCPCGTGCEFVGTEFALKHGLSPPRI